MNKLLSLSALLFLLLVSFLVGTWFNQYEGGRTATDTTEREVIHFVDPMDPSHISKEPGIAPCGMPMEPVYADTDTAGPAGVTGSPMPASPGAVKINLQKQQIIGVQIGKVEKEAETHSIRALGRIAANENRIYTIYAATDGWMGEIHESTTGSLVGKDQLLAQVKVYDYDFFTWQQRYLTELGNTGRRPVYTTFRGQAWMDGSGGPQTEPLPITAGKKAMPMQPAATERKTVKSDGIAAKQAGIPPGDLQYGEAGEKPAAKQEMDQDGNRAMPMSKPEITPPDPNDHAGMGHSTPPQPPSQPETDHSQHKMEDSGGMKPMREDDILYASRARLELLDFGVGETQLANLAKTGIYVTRLDFRSPVDGLVLTRNVSPRQWISRGTECFRIADLSKVWVEVDIYDIEAQYIQPGMRAMVALPGEDKYYAAAVSIVPPRFDAASRTLKVRLEVDNPVNILRPEMFVDVDFHIKLPETLAVPSGAVIDSGQRKTVYVVAGEGIFEPREVRTGWHYGDRVEIVEGLKEGDTVVVSGMFLVDSESRMKLAAARLMADSPKPDSKNEKVLQHTEPEPLKISPPEQQKISAAAPIDPVCGMKVPDREQAETAGLTAEFEGETFYFCSADCKDQFERNPQSYIGQLKDSPHPPFSPAAKAGRNHD